MNKLDMVKDFRRTMGLPVNDEPTELSRESRELHARLITEEAGEILEAINPDGTINKLKARDVSGDLLYFALGLMAEAGLDWDEQQCICEVLDDADEMDASIADPDQGMVICRIHKDIVEVAGISPAMVEETADLLCHYAILIDAVIGELDKLDSDFALIHAANMAKLWTTVQMMMVFDPCGQHHQEKDGSWTNKEGWTATKAAENLWVLRLNGKVQKPPGWKAAVLEGGAV